MISDSFAKRPLMKVIYALSKDLLDRYPDGFMATQRWVRRKHPTRASLLSPSTDIAIECFPRSGSSFLCRAFEADSRRRPVIAFHVHHSSHVIQACRRGVPALVLIRAPRDAIVSAKALAIASAPDSAAERAFPMWALTRAYVHFYERLLPHLDSLVLAEFGQVVQNAGIIIRRVNDRFGTRFEEFVHTPETEQAIFAGNGCHLSPNRERDLIKARIAGEYDAAANRRWAARAERLHEDLTHYARPARAAAPPGDGGRVQLCDAETSPF